MCVYVVCAGGHASAGCGASEGVPKQAGIMLDAQVSAFCFLCVFA